MFDFIFKWALDKAKDYVLRNWKTTVIGIVGSVATQIPALAPHKEQIMAATVALIALVSKDGDKTGTTAEPRVATSASAMKVVRPGSTPLSVTGGLQPAGLPDAEFVTEKSGDDPSIYDGKG